MRIWINNIKIKKYLAFLILAVVGFFLPSKVLANDKVNVYLFWGEGCPHCEKERLFLSSLANRDKDIVLHEYEVYNDLAGRSKMLEAAEKLNIEISGVPLLVIGDKYLVGYSNDNTTGKEIMRMVEEHRKNDLENGCSDIFVEDTDDTVTRPAKDGDEECSPPKAPNKVLFPKVGNIDMENLSLPALTVILGFLDGFNPCAMWVLLFLISLLIGMHDKKKMWILGIAFIFASAFVYFLFMVAWLNLFQFVGIIFWVRAIIAGIALAGGYVSIKKYFSKDPSGCDVGNSEKKKKTLEKIGQITSNKSFLLSLIGIIGLAFAVNLVELVCSAGLPAVYTQVLAINKMSGASYYLYILFFMLDDLFVFFVAMTTLKMTGITTRYVKYTRLIGGVLMLVIGFLLLFKPELLMFG